MSGAVLFWGYCVAIGAAFEPYLQFALMLLMQAPSTRAPANDEDLIDYVNLLRESILEAYTGIVQGLGDRVDLFIPCASSAMQFLQQVQQTPKIVLETVDSAVGPSIRDQMNQHLLHSC